MKANPSLTPLTTAKSYPSWWRRTGVSVHRMNRTAAVELRTRSRAERLSDDTGGEAPLLPASWLALLPH